jgi:hypothetical protein
MYLSSTFLLSPAPLSPSAPPSPSLCSSPFRTPSLLFPIYSHSLSLLLSIPLSSARLSLSHFRSFFFSDFLIFFSRLVYWPFWNPISLSFFNLSHSLSISTSVGLCMISVFVFSQSHSTFYFYSYWLSWKVQSKELSFAYHAVSLLGLLHSVYQLLFSFIHLL